MPKKIPQEIRFYDKFIAGKSNECWEWKGAINNVGYGMFRENNDKMVTAHRKSYELHKGEIPKGMCICHSCDNPKCVNPDHLWLGTIKDNIDDMIRKGRNKFVNDNMPKSTCNVCGVTLPANTIGRWHNDKCKHNSINTLSTDVNNPQGKH